MYMIISIMVISSIIESVACPGIFNGERECYKQ